MAALETRLFPESYGQLATEGDVPGLPDWGREVRAVHRIDSRAVSHARDLVLDDERSWDLPDRPACSGGS